MSLCTESRPLSPSLTLFLVYSFRSSLSLLSLFSFSHSATYPFSPSFLSLLCLFPPSTPFLLHSLPPLYSSAQSIPLLLPLLPFIPSSSLSFSLLFCFLSPYSDSCLDIHISSSSMHLFISLPVYYLWNKAKHISDRLNT